MALAKSPQPKWTQSPPNQFDIVACYFPETNPKGALRLRPCLVENVYQGKSGLFAVDVAFGTSNLKISQRMGLDLIIQNLQDMNTIGLPMATRFDLDPVNSVRLPWIDTYFGCWRGYPSPFIGRITAQYQKEYAYCKLQRLST